MLDLTVDHYRSGWDAVLSRRKRRTKGPRARAARRPGLLPVADTTAALPEPAQEEHAADAAPFLDGTAPLPAGPAELRRERAQNHFPRRRRRPQHGLVPAARRHQKLARRAARP